MTTQKYIRKLAFEPLPQQPRRAVIRLRYSAAKAEKLAGSDNLQQLRDSFGYLATLVRRGFLGLRDLSVSVKAPAPNLLEVRLEAEHLHPGAITVALRMLVGANDNSPEDFQMLLYALDDDLDAALEAYDGTNFETDVEGIDLSVDGSGPQQPFDPFWLDGRPGPLWQAGRLTIPGWASHMPDPETENAILMLSSLGAFMPLGVEADFELGEEEYFPAGADLAITRISMEAASLQAILSCLGPWPVPDPIEA